MRNIKPYIALFLVLGGFFYVGYLFYEKQQKASPYYEKIQRIQVVPLTGNDTHTCIDSTHLTCDGECTCDGMECINTTP